MSLVWVGACSHAPGITGRAHLAPPEVTERVHRALFDLGDSLKAARADALIVIAAEHFANFFFNNMPAFAMSMASSHVGPIEDPAWLGIARRTLDAASDLSGRMIREVMQTVDVATSEEWVLDHGIMVPLHFLTPQFDLPIIACNINCQGPPLTPLNRAWAFGQALRRACDAAPERIALVATGGISHWPATPDSGKINSQWDADFLRHWASQDKDAMLAYTDESTYAQAGQGGFEIRCFIAAAAAAQGLGTIHFCEAVPTFAVSCTTATMAIA